MLVSGAWGYFDHHGDEVQWGGIEKGLTPLLPTIDRVLVNLGARSGESRPARLDADPDDGRVRPLARHQRDAGRDHWTNVMSMVIAGGGLRHGQVIGTTDPKGHGVTGRVIPDLAATVFRHLGIDLAARWIDAQGRPIPMVDEGGRPIAELF